MRNISYRRHVSETSEVDVLIVGAGPVGLYGAYYAGFRGLRTAVIDMLPQLGGQVIAMYPEKPIFDIAGFPQVTGRALIENLVAQAAPFEPAYLLGRQAVTLGYQDGLPVITTGDGSTLAAKALILTAGLGTFTPRPLSAAAGYEDRGLAYFVQSLDDYADQDVMIVGGGDSAFDWAVTLEPIARSVTLVHRRDRFRAHHGTVAAVQRSTVRMLVNSEVTEVRGSDAVEGVAVRSLLDGAVQDVKAQAIIAALGFTTHLGPLADWGLTLQARHIVVDTRMATNLPRVYAAGDIAEYAGKVRLIAVGFGEVALAVNNAATVIDPDAQLFPGHSTDAAA